MEERKIHGGMESMWRIWREKMYRMMRVEYKGQWKSRKREREKMRGFGLI